MNYFAHGRHFVDNPYFLAGTAIPDWLNVVNRRIRTRSKHALPYIEHSDPRIAAIAQGIVQHHRDDAWFHETTAFAELSWKLTVRVRDSLPADEGFRPSFLGHILVEILLDAALIAENEQSLRTYYLAMQRVDADLIQQTVSQISGGDAERLAFMISGFCREQFLWDYADDGKLWFRLNQVMRRVGLAPLPSDFCTLLGEARQLVAARRDELLAGPDGNRTLTAHRDPQEIRP